MIHFFIDSGEIQSKGNKLIINDYEAFRKKYI